MLGSRPQVAPRVPEGAARAIEFPLRILIAVGDVATFRTDVGADTQGFLDALATMLPVHDVAHSLGWYTAQAPQSRPDQHMLFCRKG